MFMQRAQNVLRHYSVQTTQKTMDIMAFVGVAAFLYVPRVVALANKSKAPRVVTPTFQQQPQPVQANDAPPGSPMETLFAAANTAHPEGEGF